MFIPSGVIGTVGGAVDSEDLANVICKGVALSITKIAPQGVFLVSFGETAIEDYIALPTAAHSSDYSASLHARIPSNGKTPNGFQLEVLDESGEFVDPKILQVGIFRVPQ